jgi:hypothetical protein
VYRRNLVTSSLNGSEPPSSSGNLAMLAGDPPGLVAREEVRVMRCAAGKRLPVGVADDEGGLGLLDGPEPREGACLRRSQSASLRHHGRALSTASSPSSLPSRP